MSLKLKKWVAIINPNAGKVAVQSEWIHIQQAFAKYGVVAVFVFTEEAGQAIPMTKELIREGYRNIIENIEVAEKEYKTITLQALQPIYGILKVNVKPIGSIIEIDGENVRSKSVI